MFVISNDNREYVLLDAKRFGCLYDIVGESNCQQKKKFDANVLHFPFLSVQLKYVFGSVACVCVFVSVRCATTTFIRFNSFRTSFEFVYRGLY